MFNAIYLHRFPFSYEQQIRVTHLVKTPNCIDSSFVFFATVKSSIETVHKSAKNPLNHSFEINLSIGLKFEL